MFKTQERNFTVKRGDTWDPAFKINTAPSTPLNLTDWGVLVQAGDVALTDTHGLIITADQGRIDIELTDDQTLAQPSNTRARWYLRLTNPNGRSGVLIDGTLTFEDP